MISGKVPASTVVPFVDLAQQRARIGAEIDRAIARVLDHGKFILGPEVFALEERLAAFCGARHAITCASGTDALVMVLMAKGVCRNDAVICPAFTYAATAEAIAMVGATPVFADVDGETFNMGAANILPAIAAAHACNLRPAAVISVDLFGQPPDYERIEAVCRDHEMFLVSDAAQSFGAALHGRMVGTFGAATCTSFFPSKPLGCYGDGGAIFTDDDDLADILRSIRIHGQSNTRDYFVRIGLTGRLDTIQAAILLQKMEIFSDEIAARERIAQRYDAALSDSASVPGRLAGARSVWAQYTLRVPPARRAGFRETLTERAIPTAVYYATPLHRQPAYGRFPVAAGGLPVSERLSTEVVSLPIHAYLDVATQDRISSAAVSALR